ncbi:MAG: exopolysaccharide biosynthesis polyprenyl glycosylphosphotransferase [Ignavibacteriaceae bacterium]
MIVNEKSLKNLKLISDLLLLNTSFVLAAVLAQSLELLLAKSFLFILLFLLNFIWIFVANTINFYDDSLKLFAFQFTNLFKLVLLQSLASILFIFVVKEGFFTRNFILIYSFSLIILITFRHAAFKKSMAFLRKKGKSIKKVIIVGYGKVGKELGVLITENPGFGYKVMGYLDNTQTDPTILGKVSDLENFLSDINEVFISNADASSETIDKIVKICNKNAVGVHIIPDYFRFMSRKFQMSTLGNIPIISVRAVPLEEFQWRFIKQSFDLIVSLTIFLLLLWWFIPLVGLIIKLNSTGPYFFKQKRIGKNNKEFTCYKFRTMHVSSEKKRFVPIVKGDSRITSFGRFLRRSNIDELPQFINILLGEMSIVGPRPHATFYNEEYKDFFEDIKLRNLVKPGITGWAQIHGLRGDDPDPEKNRLLIKKRIEFDLWYIENWSFTLDIQILLLTFWRIFKGDVKGH